MEITPNLKVSIASELQPADLFVVHDDEMGECIALAVKDPHSGNQLAILLGSDSRKFPEAPILTGLPSHLNVVSFSKEYTFRLPCEAKRWLPIEPRVGRCLILSGDKLYVRASYGQFDRGVQVYVCLNDGLLLMNASGEFARPPSQSAFAVDWAFLTTENDPRVILPFSKSES